MHSLDSSKDSSLQSDTSIESEDSFASVIYIPKPEQVNNNDTTIITTTTNSNIIKISSVPSSPLIMPCPTPAHSPAPHRCRLEEANVDEPMRFLFEEEKIQTADITMCKQTTRNPPPSIQKNEPKITRAVVNSMPTVPKYRKPNNYADSQKVIKPAVPKMTTLELFNPETDDVDSDSSEPSSPDSIDSVINALKPNLEQVPLLDDNGTSSHLISQEHTTSTTIELCLPPKCCADKDMMEQTAIDEHEQQQQLVDFAEQLSAQLLKELNKDSNVIIEKDGNNCSNGNKKPDNAPLTIESDDNFIRRLNSERNLATLRERRLMLANLNSNSSFSSTIHEEDESSPTKTSDSELENDKNGLSVSNCKDIDNEFKTRHNYLAKFSDESPDHLVINSNDNLDLGNVCDKISSNNGYCRSNNSIERKSRGRRSSADSLNLSSIRTNENRFNKISDDPNDINYPDSRTTRKFNTNDHSQSVTATTHNNDSWTHSNSTVSLDSPSVGGASTHHRYYHVFREGELDSLINHHVTSLHIVSSYYERASWCVVAEKVQVWTI